MGDAVGNAYFGLYTHRYIIRIFIDKYLACQWGTVNGKYVIAEIIYNEKIIRRCYAEIVIYTKVIPQTYI